MDVLRHHDQENLKKKKTEFIRLRVSESKSMAFMTGLMTAVMALKQYL